MNSLLELITEAETRFRSSQIKKDWVVSMAEGLKMDPEILSQVIDLVVLALKSQDLHKMFVSSNYCCIK